MRLLVRAAIIPPALAVAHSIGETRLRALPSTAKTRNTSAQE